MGAGWVVSLPPACFRARIPAMKPSISIILTAFREADTIGIALQPLIDQSANFDAEILVICPDEETAEAARRYKGVRVLRDPALGKPAALNLVMLEAQGQILVLSDGDVQVAPGALAALLAPFDDPQTGVVSGRPVSRNPRDRMLGYWSHLLTDAGAHQERERLDAAGRFFVCSGYFYAFRAGLVKGIPEYALAEDALVSHLIAELGYRTRYAPEARVLVRYPDHYADWLRQKVRSAGGYAQPVIAKSPLRMRSFRHEAVSGSLRALRYARNAREFGWTLALFAARLHLWLLIFWRVRVLNTPLIDLWLRVESTKGDRS